MHWYNDLVAKDWITLGASASALLFSVISYRQKTADSKLALRKQLTDTLKEIVELNVREATYRDAEKRDAYPRNYGGLIADQRRYLVRQAASLADDLGQLANSFERQLIAGTFDAIDYREEAVRFFLTAIQMKQSSVDKGLALRNYGRFLFRDGMEKQAAMSYKEAIEAFHGATDRFRFYRGDTYIQHAREQMMFNGDRERARALLELARTEFSAMKNENRKTRELNRVDNATNELIP